MHFLDIPLARYTLGEVAVSVEELPRLCRIQLLPLQPIWHWSIQLTDKFGASWLCAHLQWLLCCAPAHCRYLLSDLWRGGILQTTRRFCLRPDGQNTWTQRGYRECLAAASVAFRTAQPSHNADCDCWLSYLRNTWWLMEGQVSDAIQMYTDYSSNISVYLLE